MGWNPYRDQEIRAYSHIVTTLFPEQTKTLPRILIWSVIFLIDLSLGVFAAIHFGLLRPENYNGIRDMMIPVALLVTGIVVVFWLQGIIWGAITRLFRKLFQKKTA